MGRRVQPRKFQAPNMKRDEEEDNRDGESGAAHKRDESTGVHANFGNLTTCAGPSTLQDSRHKDKSSCGKRELLITLQKKEKQLGRHLGRRSPNRKVAQDSVW
jgi:hypothetical protein